MFVYIYKCIYRCNTTVYMYDIHTYLCIYICIYRCNITYNVLSKRRLNALVTKGLVNGWDDPRLLTLGGSCI